MIFIRDNRAWKAIVPFLKHPNAWYRQQAAKAIERIDEGPKTRVGGKPKRRAATAKAATNARRKK